MSSMSSKTSYGHSDFTPEMARQLMLGSNADQHFFKEWLRKAANLTGQMPWISQIFVNFKPVDVKMELIEEIHRSVTSGTPAADQRDLRMDEMDVDASTLNLDISSQREMNLNTGFYRDQGLGGAQDPPPTNAQGMTPEKLASLFAGLDQDDDAEPLKEAGEKLLHKMAAAAGSPTYQEPTGMPFGSTGTKTAAS